MTSVVWRENTSHLSLLRSRQNENGFNPISSGPCPIFHSMTMSLMESTLSACKNIYHSFKVFRRFRLAPIPRLNVQNHLALTIFGRCEQYAIHSMVYLLGKEVDRCILTWKRGC